MAIKRIIFWGGTGQARVLNEALDLDQFNLCLIVDRRAIESPFAHVPIVLGQSGLAQWRADHGAESLYFSVAVGGILGKDRIEIADYLIAQGLIETSIIHRTAYLAKDAQIGPGAQVLATSTICASVKIGRQVIVNTAASIDHESVIEDGVHISVGARIAGRVLVKRFAFIGVGAIVLPDLTIGDGAVIGAGAVVTKSVAPGKVMVGNPARELTR
jgi:sugar O-acyltransferase (sialic acid O-acetyltransferase NeuD family)